MSDDSTPTTAEVRERFIDGFPMDTWAVARGECGSDFGRWLAAHDAEVAHQQAERDAQIVEGISDYWRVDKYSAAIRAQFETVDRPAVNPITATPEKN